jgi:hypothetical protein
MLRFDVPATHFQALSHGGRQADTVAILACLDASLHGGIDCGLVLHERSFEFI